MDLRKKNNRGTTLIELMVVISVGTIIVMTTMYTMAGHSRHISDNTRKNKIYNEVHGIMYSLTTLLRKSPEVLEYSTDEIKFISPHSEDTLSYVLYGEELIKNDNPLLLISQNAYISEFTIEEIEEAYEERTFGYILLSIVLEITDSFNNKVRVQKLVSVKYRQNSEDTMDFF